MALQADDTTRHLHVLGVPFDRIGVHGWNAACKDSPLAEAAHGVGREFLSVLQSDYHSADGARFGLGTPDGTSTRGDGAPDRLRGLRDRAAAADRKAAEAEARLKDERERGRSVGRPRHGAWPAAR